MEAKGVMSKWQEVLINNAKEIVRHGQGKMTFNVGPLGKDETSILIEAGKTHRFIVARYDNNIEE